MERIAAGFALAEAPVWDGDGTLWVSDAIGGGLRGLGLDGSERAVLVPERRGIGGAALHVSGGILVSGRDVALLDRAGEPAVVAGRPDGCTGFNDLAPTPDGGVLVGGLAFRPFAGEAPAPGILLHLSPSGQASVWDRGSIVWPNGIAFSDDGSVVYACDYQGGTVLRSPWTPGQPASLQPWWESPSGEADGLAVDAHGHVLVALGSGGGIARVDPAGQVDRVIDVPAPFVASCAFAGNGLEALVATTAGDRWDQPGGGVFVADAPVPGLPLPVVQIQT